MATILVVDDSPMDQRRAAFFLEELGASVVIASDGRQALQEIVRRPPDLVVSDLIMPEVDGLQLLREVVLHHPEIPVVIMTGHGSEEIAVQAFEVGAASYVPKKNLARDLARVVENTLALAAGRQSSVRLFDWMVFHEQRFEFPAQWSDVEALISYLQESLRQMKLFPVATALQVGTALVEAVTNAVEHGTLELASDWRGLPRDAYQALANERRREAPYRDRKIRLTVRLEREQATYIIADEGPGFDLSEVPDPRDPANLERASGRGLLLIHTFMDEVTFNNSGNELTMVKRRRPTPAP